MTVVTTLAKLEDMYRIAPTGRADPGEHRATTAQLPEYPDEDRDNDMIPVATLGGTVVLCLGQLRNRLAREWSNYWLANDGPSPSAERIATGTAAYALLMVLPLSLNLSALSG